MLPLIALLGFLLVGLIVATIAKALLPGRDPGPGLTLLLGTSAQIVVWAAGRMIGDAPAQPWSFFLSVGVAAVLLHLLREAGLDNPPAPAASKPAEATDATPIVRPRNDAPSIWSRLAMAPPWAAAGALLLGVTGFVIGFFGPMRFQPWANQGPMVGIVVTGPAGVLLGAVIGAALRIARPEWPFRRRLWMLNAVNVAYGLLVLDLVADRSWWH